METKTIQVYTSLKFMDCLKVLIANKLDALNVDEINLERGRRLMNDVNNICSLMNIFSVCEAKTVNIYISKYL